MAASERQVLSNRRNALRSTGPRTDEGKAVSRANSYRHGLTGAGVVVPPDERAYVAARVEAVQASSTPEGDPISLILAQQVAFLSIRQERCFHHIEAVTEERVRNAEADHDDARRSAAEHLLGYIGAEPITHRRRLLATPEGTDLLIETLEKLRGDVGTPEYVRWTDFHGSKLEQYLGAGAGMVPVPRAAALTALIARNDATRLDPAEVAHLGADYKVRLAWALPELLRVIDDELGRLHAHRAGMDRSRAAASRAGAAPGPRGGRRAGRTRKWSACRTTRRPPAAPCARRSASCTTTAASPGSTRRRSGSRPSRPPPRPGPTPSSRRPPRRRRRRVNWLRFPGTPWPGADRSTHR